MCTIKNQTNLYFCQLLNRYKGFYFLLSGINNFQGTFKYIIKQRILKNIVSKIIRFTLFLAVGGFIFWLIYRDQDVDRIINVLTNEVNYFWIVFSLFIGLLSHISRTLRWGLMIEPVSHKPRFTNTFLAVMIGYLMNLAFPRMGEVSRCGVMSRYEKISFSKLLGTVVAERAVDMLSLLVLLAVVVVSQFGQMLRFLDKNPEIESKLLAVVTSPVLIIVVVVLAIAAIVFRSTLRHTLFYKKLQGILVNLKEGFLSIRQIRKKGWFLFHSVAIWVLYYLMLYAVFFAFDFTSALSPIAALTTFVLASFGMVAPVQGGIGAWHFMAIEGLALYGVLYENAVIFAFVAHASMTLMMIVLGLISLLVLPFVNRRNFSTAETVAVKE